MLWTAVYALTYGSSGPTSVACADVCGRHDALLVRTPCRLRGGLARSTLAELPGANVCGASSSAGPGTSGARARPARPLRSVSAAKRPFALHRVDRLLPPGHLAQPGAGLPLGRVLRELWVRGVEQLPGALSSAATRGS